ncbi:hypothetical protein JB92DRAFT_3134285 [Gautieria morchelliformis]|nr:hypothetical protein JB92DRAFT_3134285 [Gautieria morchelliformis]
MDVETEQYILLLLSDGNLPTGSFVASSGLESYVKHGFFASSVTSHGSTEKTMDFVRYSLESYSHSALPFVMDAHVSVSGMLAAWKERGVQTFEGCRDKIIQLDALYDAMTLNHVARRASKAQGVALLTLFSKGFSPPTWLASEDSDDDKRWSSISSFVDHLKLDIRRSATHGHLPVFWGVLTAALRLSVERSQYLHLFLHARGLLSAAIRMNIIGPYAAQQLLLHAIRPLVQSQMAQCRHIHTGVALGASTDDQMQATLATTVDGPANTWPLGEILATRHDLQHSRIFNS